MANESEMTPVDVPRLPKKVEADAAAEKLASELVARARPLWGGAELAVAQVDLGADLEAALKGAFGSLDAFKQSFTLAALEVFGSGWAWLAYDVAADALLITSTANQDTPAMQPGMLPILGLDVWEHAYYLKHQANRKAYIEAFWNVVNWPEVEQRYDAASDAAASAAGKAEL